MDPNNDSLVDVMGAQGQPVTESPLTPTPAPVIASEPAAPAPPASTGEAVPPPEGNVAPPEGDGQEEDLLTYLLRQEAEAPPKSEQGATALEQMLSKDPEASKMFQEYIQEQSKATEQFSGIRERVEPLGGLEVIPQALDLYERLNMGLTPLEDGRPAQMAVIQDLIKTNPQAGYELIGQALNVGLQDSAAQEILVEQFCNFLGLKREMLNDYVNVTIDGGYKTLAEPAARDAAIEAINKLRTENEMGLDYAKAFNQVPEKVQFQILEAYKDDPKYAKWLLDAPAERIAEQEAFGRWQVQERERQTVQLQTESVKESNVLMREALGDHMKSLVAKGLDEQTAKIVMYDVIMDMWENYFTDGSPVRTVDTEFLQKAMEGNRIETGNAKKKYFDTFDGLIKSTLRKTSVSKLGLPARKGRPVVPPGSAGQFVPDSGPGSQSSGAASLADAMAGM